MAGERHPPEVLERFAEELDLVEIIARQVSQSIAEMVDLDDLLSAGREGLLDAARRFDPSRNVPFRVYANLRVRGAIFDGVRSMAPLSRRAYQRLAALEAASLVTEGAVEDAFKPDQPIDEVEAEEALGEHLAMIALASAVGLLAEAARGEAEASEGAVSGDPEEAYSRAELLGHVQRALSELHPNVEAQVIRLHYFEGLSLMAIARELGTDASWVSRLHTRAIARLAKRLRRLA